MPRTCWLIICVLSDGELRLPATTACDDPLSLSTLRRKEGLLTYLRADQAAQAMGYKDNRALRLFCILSFLEILVKS